MTTARAAILLVEDDEDIRESVKEALEDHDYVVYGAGDGCDALEQLRSMALRPDLVLLDLMMPRMNGAEFCEEIAKVGAWAGIPVILLSADAQIRAKATALRAADYLQKPIRLSVLLETIARTLRPNAQSPE